MIFYAPSAYRTSHLDRFKDISDRPLRKLCASDYEGAGIEPRHLDHLGFRVEDVEAFKKHLKALVNRNPALSPKPSGTEGEIRLKLLAKCKHGQFQLADPDGVPIDVSAAR